jgi:quinol monooxygenase YgiN
MLFEVYADETAFERHQQTPAFRKYVAEAVPLLASRERQIWRRVDPGPSGTQRA